MRNGLLFVLLIVVSGSLSSAQTARVTIQLRDVETGYGVHGRVSSQLARYSSRVVRPAVRQTNAHGRVTLRVTPGEYLFEEQAPGYAPMKRHVSIGSAQNLSIQVMMHPSRTPQELNQLQGLVRSGWAVLYGYVLDGTVFTPIVDAELSDTRLGIQAKTDDRGFFVLEIPTRASEYNELPDTTTIKIKSTRHQDYILRNTSLIENSYAGHIVDLQSGKGVAEEDDSHKLMVSATNEAAQQIEAEIVTQPLNDSRVKAQIRLLPLPGNIIVGLKCKQRSCASASQYALEDYVKLGLGKEWLPSWATDSLEAGAVAYRSYGAYYVANPICPAIGPSCPVVYDICSNTYCQVFVPRYKPPQNVLSAAVATVGMVLSQDGINVFRTEYASVQNGIFCPDGYTGQPSAGWPCMVDWIDGGQKAPRKTHGRGMSQWGSQFWAVGKSYQGVPTAARDWRCILDHYYNDNGNSTGAGTGARTVFTNGPGGDGPVAFALPTGSNSYDIYSMNIDGSAVTRLTNDKRLNRMPSWSPMGNLTAFSDGQNIWTMNADGSNEVQIASGSTPTWSPIGDKIAFATATASCSGNPCLSVMNPDGTKQTNLQIPVDPGSVSLTWGPAIAYGLAGNIYSVGSDGSGNTLIYTDPNGGYASGPSWSPDGSRLAIGLAGIFGQYNYCGIYTINSDGSNPTRITAPDCSNTVDEHPSWSADGQTIVFARGNPSFQLFSVQVAPPYAVSSINSTSSYEPDPDCRQCNFRPPLIGR